MKILSERNFNCKSYITENKNTGNKEYWMDGITIESEIVNNNARRYPKHVIEKAIKDYLSRFKLGENCYGELDHPLDDDPRSTYVNPKETSHLFTEIRNDGNVWFTKSKVMDTPNGKIVKAFTDAGAVLGISTRGFGDFSMSEADGRQIYDITDFEFISFGDYVTDPSAPNAYLQAISERKNWVYEAGIWKCKEIQVEKHIDKVSKALKQMNANQIHKESINFFNEYFNILLKK